MSPPRPRREVVSREYLGFADREGENGSGARGISARGSLRTRRMLQARKGIQRIRNLAKFPNESWRILDPSAPSPPPPRQTVLDYREIRPYQTRSTQGSPVSDSLTRNICFHETRRETIPDSENLSRTILSSSSLSNYPKVDFSVIFSKRKNIVENKTKLAARKSKSMQQNSRATAYPRYDRV